MQHVVSACVLGAVSMATCTAQRYQLSEQIKLQGSGGWDYLYADVEARRLYVSHSSLVHVIDMDSLHLVGELQGFEFVHGIVTVPALGIGFISDGKQNRVAVFDTKSMQVKTSIETPANPNSMVLDRHTGLLFVGHKPSRSMTVIDTRTLEKKASIQLEGVPEFPVSDGEHTVFVNIDDKSEIARLDVRTMKVEGHWPLGTCKNPSGLAIDTGHHRLFSTCRNGMMAILDSLSGKILATVPIGSGPDAARFDAQRGYAFSSNGDGTLTIIGGEGDHYTAFETVPTQKGGRTMALDEKTGTIFVSTAEFAPTKEGSSGRPVPIDGTFRVLVVRRKDQ